MNSSIKRKNALKNNLQVYSFIAIPVIGFLMFSLYPIIWTFVVSLCRYDYVSYKFVGLKNFIRIFTQDTVYWQSVLNTFIIGLGKLVFEIPLSLVLAYILSRKIKGAQFFKSVFFMPTMIATSVVAMIFSLMFSSYNGMINEILMSIGLVSEPINWFGERFPAIVTIWSMSVWHMFGINMLYFLAGIANVPEELYESSSLDGANAFQQFWYITLPEISSMTKVILMMAITGAVKIMDSILLLTNGGPANGTNVAMLYIYKYFFQSGEVAGGGDYGYGAALGVVTSIIIFGLTQIYFKVTKKMDND